MLMIRLQRVGRVHEPTFRVVLVDSKRGPKSGHSNTGNQISKDRLENILQIPLKHFHIFYALGTEQSSFQSVNNFEKF